jgi:hypothetical protein
VKYPRHKDCEIILTSVIVFLSILLLLCRVLCRDEAADLRCGPRVLRGRVKGIVWNDGIVNSILIKDAPRVLQFQ